MSTGARSARGASSKTPRGGSTTARGAPGSTPSPKATEGSNTTPRSSKASSPGAGGSGGAKRQGSSASLASPSNGSFKQSSSASNSSPGGSILPSPSASRQGSSTSPLGRRAGAQDLQASQQLEKQIQNTGARWKTEATKVLRAEVRGMAKHGHEQLSTRCRHQHTHRSEGAILTFAAMHTRTPCIPPRQTPSARPLSLAPCPSPLVPGSPHAHFMCRRCPD